MKRRESHPQDLPLQVFWGGIVLVACLSFGLRFWHLDQFNTLVFDEIYFARFAHHYLTQTPFFDAHPPLGKYLIAWGIVLQGFTAWGMRWMNALIGGCIPLLGVAIAHHLTGDRRFALLTGVLLDLDGLLLVESRYALLNVYLLFFGLAGQWCLLKASVAQSWQRGASIIVAALCFGATVSVKWNGLGLLLGFHLLWLISPALYWLQDQLPVAELHQDPLRPWNHLRSLRFSALFVALPAIALLLYGLLWIPHLHQNLDVSLGQLNVQMFQYHASVGNGVQTHPYCSPWSSWPLMLRPVSYFFQTTRTLQDPVPVVGPPLPEQTGNYYYSVYAIGNPILWWLSTVALLIIAIASLGLGLKLIDSRQQPHAAWPNPTTAWMLLYLGVNYGANLAPWALISRCAFLYHYMPANFFAVMALAWQLNHMGRSPHPWKRWIAISCVLMVVAGFFFWLPLYLGWPLTPESWRIRMWFTSWI